ncbi:MAG: hypothetical protein ABW063_07480 [Caulobacter sp.]
MFQRTTLLLALCGVASLLLLGAGGALVFRGPQIWMLASGVGMIIIGLVAGVVAVLGAMGDE